MSYQSIKQLIIGIGCFFPLLSMAGMTTYPANQTLYEKYRWAVTYYYGETKSAPLISMFEVNWPHWSEHIQSFELARTLCEENFLRRLVKPLVGIVQVAGNVTIRQGSNENTIYEFDPYLVFRWANLTWNHYVNTSLALGEGVSYASSVPAIEKRQNNHTKRLLNYLMFEATVAHPCYPKVQLLARIHHRSGAYGLYHAGNTGSNVIGIGIRYLFD